jgi:hypothetical protein
MKTLAWWGQDVEVEPKAGDCVQPEHWRLGVHPESGDVIPSRCVYSTESFASLEAAAKRACEANCYGPEGFVNVQEYRPDADFFEETGRARMEWVTVERWLCHEGKVVERVDGY